MASKPLLDLENIDLPYKPVVRYVPRVSPAVIEVEELHEAINEFETNPIYSEKPCQMSDRIRRRAKRLSKFNSGMANKTGAQGSISQWSSPKDAKNSRRPRTRYGRGLPKKGGAGGKGTWGKPGSELTVEGVDINKDANDPNYDSESQESYEFEAIVPELSEEELEKSLNSVFMEYFEHGDTEDVIISLEEMNIGEKKPSIVVFAITLALERKPSQREMTSVLLSDMYGLVLSEEDIQHGFGMLLEKLPDLVLDTPDAAVVLGNFIARAVADDCLPPKFIHTYKKNECLNARTCIEHANTLLNMKHGLVRLDNVWGVGGGMRPVKYLVKQIQLLLKEYNSSGDIEEATRCLQELEVPHFHHELVYEAIVMVLEDMNEKTMESMCKLFKSLCDSVVVSVHQLKNGFERVYAEMPDICIDVPPAYMLLKQFVAMCNNYGFMPQELLKSVPVRGRKRFVSEGDGGLVKE